MENIKLYDTEYLNDVIEYNKYRSLCNINGVEYSIVNELEKTLNARQQKVGRINRRLVYLLTRCDYIWFITFTFDNHYINKSDRTKRDLMKEVLNTHDFKYMLNIDYGKSTEREHYHCILGTNIDFDVNQYIKSFYPCFSLSIQCKKGKNDYKRLSKYINKLTNHCIKATTKNRRMLYNFKGYDLFCETQKEKTYFYHLDRNLLK